VRTVVGLLASTAFRHHRQGGQRRAGAPEVPANPYAVGVDFCPQALCARLRMLAALQCTFADDGWLEAGGFVTNRGDSDTSVTVNLLVGGKYVDCDYLPTVKAGETASWSVTEPDVSRGTCTAELD
jgi:hypothetical protein